MEGPSTCKVVLRCEAEGTGVAALRFKAVCWDWRAALPLFSLLSLWLPFFPKLNRYLPTSLKREGTLVMILIPMEAWAHI